MLYRLSVHLQWKYLTTDEYIRIFPILRFKNCQLKKSNLINIIKQHLVVKWTGFSYCQPLSNLTGIFVLILVMH